MEETAIRIFWITVGASSSLIVGVFTFIIRNAISKNATKENVEAKTDLLEKDITHLSKEIFFHCMLRINNLDADLKIDATIGKITLKAINACEPETIIEAIKNSSEKILSCYR